MKSLILVCRGRRYNYKQILSVVNENLRSIKTVSLEIAIFNILAKTKDAQEWLKNLSVGKDDYIDECRQRIME